MRASRRPKAGLCDTTPGWWLSAFSLRLAQPHTRASAAVLIDEHNTRGFQGAADGQVVGRGHRCLSFGEFRAPDGGNAQRRFAREIFGTPAYEATGRSHLSAG